MFAIYLWVTRDKVKNSIFTCRGKTVQKAKILVVKLFVLFVQFPCQGNTTSRNMNPMHQKIFLCITTMWKMGVVYNQFGKVR